MKQYNDDILIKIQKELELNCPSPESNLVTLGQCVATLPDSEGSAQLRHYVLDIDDLTAQIRWHLGQALLLMDSQPAILKAGEDDDDLIKSYGIPTGVELLLRSNISNADRVLYDDLSTPRRGGTVGGWIFHMMIDSAVYRTVSVLDRLMTVLWYAAELPMKERIYFRSGKVKKLNAAICSDETAHLLKIAEGKLLKLIIDYRDGLTHNTKAYSRASGFTPSEEWKDENGRRVIWHENAWDAERLFALGRASYLQFTEALEPSVSICKKKWPIKPE
jgi:hypothetical protein